MLARNLRATLVRQAESFPVVSLTGPRQSGKSTLVKAAFAKHRYLSLEDPELRRAALEDPRGLIENPKGPMIIDEVQHAPELFSYIQLHVDRYEQPGHFILTGSHNFLLMKRISQTLAGRSAILHLLPFSLAETEQLMEPSIYGLTDLAVARQDPIERSLEEVLYQGSYPRVLARRIDPRTWYAAYYQTYVERDVRQLTEVGQIETFSRFIRLCAGRTGQLLNASSLASDCGLTHTTVRRWISLLEASFLVTLLRPHYLNYGKRLIKSPKLYFLDTGLLCYLLDIRSPQELQHHSARGYIFESFVVSELLKAALNKGEQPRIFFWRDVGGHEIDILLESQGNLIALECKSGQTIAADFLVNLNFWSSLAQGSKHSTFLIYGGDRYLNQENTTILPWWSLAGKL